jgi:hypothetical protein
MARLTIACAVLGLLVGCAPEAGPARPRAPGYPALNESPAPPPPAETIEAGDVREPPDPAPETPPEIVVDEDLLWQVAREQADDLRKYAAQAAPDDPFALSEEDLRALDRDDAPLAQ